MPHPNIKLAMSAIFGVIGLVIVMLSWLTLGGLQSLNSRTIDVADNWLTKTAASGRIQTALNDLRVAYGQHLVEVNIHRMKDSLAHAREKEDALRASLSAYDAMISTDRERQIFAAIRRPLPTTSSTAATCWTCPAMARRISAAISSATACVTLRALSKPRRRLSLLMTPKARPTRRPKAV